MARPLVKGSAIYGLGTVLTRALGFILIPLYTSYFTVAEYGILALLNLILQLVSYLCLMGVSTAAMRMYFDAHASLEFRRRLYGTASLILLAAPPLVLLILGSATYYVIKYFLPTVPFAPHTVIVLTIGLFVPMIQLMNGLLRAQQRPVLFIFFGFSFFIFQAITIIVAIVWLEKGLVGQLSAQLLTNIVFWLIALIILFKHSSLSFSTTVTRQLLTLGIPLVPFFIFLWISNAAGAFLLEQFSGLNEVGIFALASQFGGILLLIGTALDNSLMPYFFKTANHPEAATVLGSLVIKYITLIGVFGLAIIVFAQPAILLLVRNPEYHGAIDYVAPLTLAGWLYLVASPIHWSLTYSKKTGVLAFIRGVSAVMLVGLLIFFLKNKDMGIAGVIYALLVTNLATVMIGYIASQKHFRIDYAFRNIVLVILLLLSAGLVIALASSDRIQISLLFVQCFILVAVMVVTFKLSGLGSPMKLLRLNEW
jgi:O-antigen/teichoic acid export membrane protein